MYNYRKNTETGLAVNNSFQGEHIETRVKRILENKEPIKDGAPLIYTERKDGVLAGYNIRTDRFEVALDATDKITGSIRAKREGKAEMKVVKNEPTQGTDDLSGTEN